MNVELLYADEDASSGGIPVSWARQGRCEGSAVDDMSTRGGVLMTKDALKVLVVDDEAPLREELRSFDWSVYGFKYVGEADNGLEALAFCRRHRPDIVITDITMPVMDGIKFMREMRQELPDTQIILLTCHSDFTYARESIGYGAIDYLLKVTLTPSELVRALDKARQALQKNGMRRRDVIEEKRWERARQLSMLLSGKKIGDEPTVASLAVYKFLTREMGCKLPLQFAALHVDAKADVRMLAKRALERQLGSLEEQMSFMYLPALEGVYLVFADNTGSLKSSITSEKLASIVEQLRGLLEEQAGLLQDELAICGVIGSSVAAPDQVESAMAAVMREQPLRFYDRTQLVWGVQDEPTQWPDEHQKAEFCELLAAHINPMNGGTAQLRGSLVSWAFQHRLHPDAFKELVNEWRREWLKDKREWHEFSQMSKAVMNADTAEELVALLIHEMEFVRNNERKPRREIDDAMRYIKSNLEKPLTLSVVAEQVGLSAHYLCRLFPEERGISFQEYIKQQRMEMAARLLRTTSLRIYEIACQVGVPSYRYFSSVFREYAGLSPTEYRRQR